jgi:hypothetical protein
MSERGDLEGDAGEGLSTTSSSAASLVDGLVDEDTVRTVDDDDVEDRADVASGPAPD